MASVQSYVTKIRTATLGKDVRSAIANAIEACYENGRFGTDEVARGDITALSEQFQTFQAEVTDFSINVELAQAAAEASAQNAEEVNTALQAAEAVTLEPNEEAYVDYDDEESKFILGIPKGEKGDTGDTGAAGTDGVSPQVTTSKSGKISTIVITDVNGEHTITVNDGADGDGTGDMIKATYDSNNDGIVDNASRLGGELPSYYGTAAAQSSLSDRVTALEEDDSGPGAYVGPDAPTDDSTLWVDTDEEYSFLDHTALVDPTLTSEGDAADAKATGDAISAINTTISGLVDNTLSISGKAADAKKVGDDLAEVVDDVSAIETQLEGLIDNTLAVEGKAADAKKVGDDLSELSSTLTTLQGTVEELDTGILVPVHALESKVTLLEETIEFPYTGRNLANVFADEIAEAETDAWSWLASRVSEGNFEGIHVGDYLPVTYTNNITFNARIAGINTYKSMGDANNVIGDHIDFISDTLWPVSFAMGLCDYNNALSQFNLLPILDANGYYFLQSGYGQVVNYVYDSSQEAYVYDFENVDFNNDGVWDFLPSALKTAITDKRLFVSQRYSAESAQSHDTGSGWYNVGRIWIPTEVEVAGMAIGNPSRHAISGSIQYPIFKNNAWRSHYRANWWLMTPEDGSITSFMMVNGYGAIVPAAATTTAKAPVCFRIGGD